MARGRFWEELPVGSRFQTLRRTVTEADLVGFIAATGMLESMFVDAEHGGVIGGRPVPAALTYSFIEGLQMQSLVQGTGLALLEVVTKVLAPVRVGDTISAVVEVVDCRETSKGGRAVVLFRVTVVNQSAEPVMHYDVKRLIAGAPKAQAGGELSASAG